jgi:hypothetical protein
MVQAFRRHLSSRKHGIDPGKSMWNLWWAKWYCDKFPSECVFLPLFVSVNQLRIRLPPNTTIIRKKKKSGRSLVVFKQSSVLSDDVDHWT